MITSTRGDVDETTLIKTEGVIDNDNEYTTWVEYRDTPDGEPIHRSVHIALKQGLVGVGALGEFS